ncbi:cleavage and polyadenylation specificity factor subunit 7 [Solea senegalensis]|uniref:Cleavage and polyadenylation specificity factor subunit 7 n=1 Tax=Solea senegalensis TaxID=28829 RepID=A0AAV6Q1A2_SOLSE|nr:cleavage and polyadenylation specificity factor subunit 7-like [Solea senegalensis]KAG7482193.1 cleavage and polyadenylation specificity factor subunit 7 [Solea senegalensis]
MAAPGAAAGPSTSNWNARNIHSDLNQNEEDLDRIAEANELFDAVLTGSVDRVKKVAKKASPPYRAAVQDEVKSVEVQGGNSQKRLSLYIGSFPWWTSDGDITSMALTLGVRDIKEIKFAENRVNGQSRGYAEVVVTSEESFKVLLEKIPQCKLNGETVECRFATRQNLTVFEDVANKRIPLRLNSKDPKESDHSDQAPSLPQEPIAPPRPPIFPTHAFPPMPFLGHPPPPFPPMPPHMPPPLPPPIFPPHPVHIPSQPPPSLHINPAFFNQDGHSSKAYSQHKQTPQSPEEDFDELMNRNRAIASSAISKAVSGATAGDLQVAMETLLTAIAIIKQSRVYRDERCQALVTSLKDCLVSIQGNYGYRGSSRSREKERDRDRGRDRERERDRERNQEDSSGWEGAGVSRRRRERSWSGDRDKERSRERERERERHRDHRDRYR